MKFKQLYPSVLSNYPELFYTSISFFIFAFIYFGLFLFIKNQDWSNDKKHRHYISIRNLLFFIFIISIIFIWSGEIKTFIFSAAAIMGATLIVFKEVILAILGSVLTNKVFSVGDYIEYDGFNGKIIDKNFLNTTVLVSAPFQNKELIFPNMHYITNKIINLSKFGKFQTYSIEISVDKMEKVQDFSRQALLFTKKALSQHTEKYQRYFDEKKREELFFEVPEVEPKLRYQIKEGKNLSFTIHYISHPLDQVAIEEEILREYLSFVRDFNTEEVKD